MPFVKGSKRTEVIPVCRICQKKMIKKWLLILSQYNSLVNINKFDVCEDCAREIYCLVEKMCRLARNVPLDSKRLFCPKCKAERYTTTPETPSPCEKCGHVYSLSSIKLEKELKKKPKKVIVKDSKGNKKVVTRML